MSPSEIGTHVLKDCQSSKSENACSISIVKIKLHMSRLENSNCLDGDEGDIAECVCPEQRDERLQRTLAALPPPLPAGRRHRSAPPRRRCSTLHQVC